MKQGSTFILVVDLDVDITQVDSVIFTLKNKDTILTKENWTYDNGNFRIPFTQEETVQLDGRTRIEAQINFNNRSVAKSEIKDVYIGETLATRIIDDNIAIEEQKEISLDIDGEIVDTGSSNYEELYNKPKINGVVLLGDVSLDVLNIASKEYVEEEIAKFDFIKIVTELPEVGLPNRIYFVPKSNTSDNDLFDEYAWVNEQWEFYGTKQIEVDLTDYVKKTDFAGATQAGIVRADLNYGLNINTGANGFMAIYKAQNKDIDDKKQGYRPIVPSNLDYAVMKALTDSKNHTWTEEEKTSALALLGALPLTTNKGTVLYGSSGGSTYMYSIMDSGINAWSIPQRSIGGVVKVGTPLADADATTKKYVDDLVGDVQTIITELHAYAETLKGGA